MRAREMIALRVRPMRHGPSWPLAPPRHEQRTFRSACNTFSTAADARCAGSFALARVGIRAAGFAAGRFGD
eukprot:5308608-Prymnesium_polylepis.1